MDALGWLLWIVAGSAAGTVAGLVPGLHANALLPLVAGLAGLGLEPLAAFLPAFATAHGFASILPATYVGVPDPDGAILSMPAHRLLREGHGPLAVRAAAQATLAATLFGVLLLWPAKWLATEPGRVGASLQGGLPLVLGALAVWLLVQGRRRFAANLVAFALAGLLGVAAARLPASGWLGPVPPAGPALAGLFGGAGLVASLGAAPPPPQHDADAGGLPRRLRRTAAGAALLGSLVAAAAAPVQALTPALAASAIPARTPERSLSTLAAVGAAHQVLALGLAWATQRPRTGVAAALATAAAAQPWGLGRPPPLLLGLLVAVLAAALLAYPVVLRLGRIVPPALSGLPPHLLPAASLALLVALQAVTAGWTGLALLVAGTCVGLVPLALRARRLQLVACLVVPALLRSLGVMA
jgi:putative membrane protein